MEIDESKSPEYVDDGDPGDEVARRFSYQWAYAAILCCNLLDEENKVEAIICEHHEDIMIKDEGGMFTAIQVKTRDDNAEPWKTSDESLFKAFCRFVDLDKQFPSFFSKFIFASNHAGYSVKNGKDIAYVLNCIFDKENYTDLAGPPKAFCSKLSAKTKVEKEEVFQTLKKCKAQFDLPKLSDIGMRLLNTLEISWDGAKSTTLDNLRAASKALIVRCREAASKGFSGDSPWYINPSQDDLDKCQDEINSKVIDLAALAEVLNNIPGQETLLTKEFKEIDRINVGENSLLREKLSAGGFSSVFVRNAEELKGKAEYLGYTWTRRLGEVKGMDHVENVRTIVRNEANKVFEAVRKKGDPFGYEMLEKLEFRLGQRLGNIISGEISCTQEHLEGFAYSQTSQCNIQWSNKEPWIAEESDEL